MKYKFLVVMALAPVAFAAAEGATAKVGFTLKVVVAPKALARLVAGRHGMQIVALYGGDPLPKWEGSVDQTSDDINLAQTSWSFLDRARS